MKKFSVILLVIFSVSFCFAETKMYVKAQNGVLLAKPSAFAKSVFSLTYGEEVVVSESDDEWALVSIPGNANAKGWIKTVELSKRKLRTSSSASANEIALAGKGFNAEIENLYSNSENGNYAAVDKVETYAVSQESVLSFIEEGNLLGADR